MAISRLLLPKPALHFGNRGFIKTTRWSSSSLSGNAHKCSQLKEPEAEKENGAVAAESEEYTRRHPSIFPEATQVRKRRRQSWLEGILSTIKDKMLGTAQDQKYLTSETSDSRVDLTAPKVNITEKLHDTKSHDPENAVQLEEVRRNSQSVRGTILSRSTSHLVEENPFEGAVDTEASQITRMHKFPGLDLSEPENAFQSSEGQIHSVSTKKSIAEGVPSHVIGDNHLENGVGVIYPEVVKVHSDPDNADLGHMQSKDKCSESDTVSHENEKKFSITSTCDIMAGNSSDESELVKPRHEQKKLEEELLDIFMDNGKDQRLAVVNFSCLTHELVNETSRAFPEDGINELRSFGNGIHELGKKTGKFIHVPSASTKVRKVASSNGSLKLKDNFARDMPGQIAGSLSNTLANNKISRNSDEQEQGVQNKLEIHDLMHLLKGIAGDKSTSKTQEGSVSNVASLRKTKPTKAVEALVNLQKLNANRRGTSLEGHDTSAENNNPGKVKEEPYMGIPFVLRRESTIENENRGLEPATHNLTKPKPNSNFPLSASEELSRTSDANFKEERSTENKILVRFLKANADRKSIITAFKDCGQIVNIEVVSSTKGCNFKDAFVHFKTREGCKNALRKTDLLVDNVEAFVEATSLEDMTEGVPIPDLIGDSDVPVALVKNPTKTVKVKHLTPDMTSQHIKDTLAFCGSSITSFFLGSSKSVAYVEFETEDAKERALARGSIYVSGKQLMILRIDAPRTTVVRISNAAKRDSFRKIFNSYGKVKAIYSRSPSVVDVHFELAEWPNMLNILNSLNGKEVNGNRLVAQPAPLFPPQILRALWSIPEEKRHVKAAMFSLLRELKEPPVTSQFVDLATKYYKEF